MNSIAAATEAEQYFHNQIPITSAMRVRVVECDENRFVVEAPVTENSNHLGTAFGASINAVATLAGYGFLWNALRDDGCHVVIAESSIRFIRPVRKTIRAICLRPVADDWNLFRSNLATNGKASLQVRVTVEEEEQKSAEFNGTFVARAG